jgi:hypothetical protein
MINNKRRRITGFDDDSVFDERGLLKDGHVARVRLQFRDGADQRHRARIVDASGHSLGLHRPGFRLPATADALQDALEDAADARAEWLDDLRNAWRGNAFTGQRGSKPGDACTIDGRPGHLRFNDDGELVCVPDTSSRGRADSRPLDAIMREHRQTMTDAYRVHAEWLANQWRNP